MPLKDPEARKAYNARRYQEKREEIRASQAAWRAAHTEEQREYHRQRFLEKREEYRARRKAQYWADPETAKADAHRWAVEHPERTAGRIERWVRENPEAAQAAMRRYKEANRERIVADARRRRARIAGAPEVERIYRARVWDRDHGICHICGTAADPADWHMDHVVALARGGPHTYGNVAVSHPSCNLRKAAS